ncbi:MAG: protease SohB [Legionellales bacterium]|nr:protease SohB [Legionellales bacterium]
MHFLAEYGMFLLKTFTLVMAVIIVLVSVAAVAGKNKLAANGKIKLKNLNKKFTDYQEAIQEAVLDKAALKKWRKEKKHLQKNSADKTSNTVFVIHYKGDVQANSVQHLQEEVNAILMAATPADEVVVVLESPGGVVHGYGLAASQLQRIKNQQIKLTVCVDKVAASGGYMMACVADKILAAPFAIVGSVGVVAQIPNFHRFLQDHKVDVELLTAGEYKRTLTLLGKNTVEGRQKFQEQLEDTHQLFKQFIKQHRPAVDLEKIATGEYWYGQQAVGLNLIDAIQTSDDYLLSLHPQRKILLVRFKLRKNLAQKISQGMQMIIRHSKEAWQEQPQSQVFL